MDILFSILIFLALTGVFALLGLNVWVWPKAAIDRVTASAGDPQMQQAAHPSLAFRDLLKKLGTLVPASPKDTTVMQRRLIRAGFRNPNALKVLYGAKFVDGDPGSGADVRVIASSSWESSTKIMAMLASVAIGFFAPNEYVRAVAQPAAEADPPRIAECARPAGGFGRIGTGSRPGRGAGGQGAGDTPTRRSARNSR